MTQKEQKLAEALVEQLKGPARTKRKEEERNETKDDALCDKTGELLSGDYIEHKQEQIT